MALVHKTGPILKVVKLLSLAVLLNMSLEHIRLVGIKVSSLHPVNTSSLPNSRQVTTVMVEACFFGLPYLQQYMKIYQHILKINLKKPSS